MNLYVHSVFFTLKHAPQTEAEKDFLSSSNAILSAIPGVSDFQVVKQKSGKCDFTWGFVMRFRDREAHMAYNDHPEHQAYVKEIWLTNVMDFQEIDYSDPD